MKDDSDPIPALKQQLARTIVERLGASQPVIARRLQIDQPRASDLARGRLQRFALQQLVRFVARADGEVTITVRWNYPRRTIPRHGAHSHRFP